MKVPYPLRAMKISIDINLFGFWWKPSFTNRNDLSEDAKEQGHSIWWFRWLWFQISYGRWV